jgi:hypothetical protein
MAPTRIVIGQTGDFLTVADAKDAAGQRQWERATQAAIEFAQNPGPVAGAKLLAIIGQRSNLGDPTEEDWLPGLPAGHRALVLQELQQLVGSWRDQTAATSGPVVETVVAEDGTIVRVPASTKASAAAALRLAADQAGPGRAELLAKAALAEQEAADLAKAAAPAPARSPRPSTARALELLARIRARVQPAEVARLGGPAALRGKAAARTGDLVPVEELYERDRPDMLFKAAGAGRRAAEADGLRARAAEYRALASVPGMPTSDVATLERAADALERQAG